MYYVRPLNPTLESITDKYQYLLAHARVLCTLGKKNHCSNVWWYNTCVGLNHSSDIIKAHCPFYRSEVIFSCQRNHSWNGTERIFFDKCQGKEFLFRTTLEFYLSCSIYPLVILVFLTSIFRIFVFDDISKFFNWRLIIWEIKEQTLKYSMVTVVVIINSAYFISMGCII